LFIFCSTSCANRASVVGNGALMPRPFRLHSSPRWWISSAFDLLVDARYLSCPHAEL
jgi:hypothetical protein